MANTSLWGTYNVSHLYNSRISEVGVERTAELLRATQAQYDRIINSLMGEWAERTTVAQEEIDLADGGTLQPLDDEGNPMPVRAGATYQVAYPIQGGGTAYGDNRVTRAMMTLAEMERDTLSALRKDSDWMIRHVLAAAFASTTWTYNDKVGANGAKGLGNITIQPLASGDTVTYLRKNGTSSTDDHILAQAADIADATNPFPTIRRELVEHPSNMNSAVDVYIASDLVDDTLALTNFREIGDPQLLYGANETVAMGGEFDNLGIGDAVLGQTDRVRVIEASVLPSGYMIGKVRGKPFLKMREYPAASLQGFFPELALVDGNHIHYRWLRYAGFGVYDRVGAVVYRVGNGTYASPYNSDAMPLPA